MSSVLVRKLSAFGTLSNDEKAILDALTVRPQKIEAHADIIEEGSTPNDVHVILSGLACRYKLLPNGSRQIVAFLLPGDFCDLHVFILAAMDHSIAAISKVEMVRLSRDTVESLMTHPGISRAMLLATLVDEATLREWVVNLGQRSAEHRIAHLFCELFLRMRVIGLTSGLECELPLTQTELGDTLGLSTVHINRSLQALKAANLVTLKGRRLIIGDLERLHKISGFRSNYLHLAEHKETPEGTDVVLRANNILQ